ncbi:MAG: hypothetical protein ABII01_00380 [Candidatus Woesearchaeota archaeon]
MKNFNKVIDEINNNLNKFVLFQEVITAIAIFLGFFLFFMIIRFDFIDPLYSAIPAGVYLGVETYYKLKKSKLQLVESHYNFLDEKLRTAADNLQIDNEMVEGLQNEIVTDLRKVDTSTFFNIKRTILKVALILAICFLIIFLNTFNIKGISIDVKDFVSADDINMKKGQGEPEQFAGGPEGVSDIEINDDDIFGIENVAKLGDDELTLGIATLGYEINVRDVKEASKREFDETFPSDITALSAAAFEENIPKEEQELVSNYFQDLAR